MVELFLLRPTAAETPFDVAVPEFADKTALDSDWVAAEPLTVPLLPYLPTSLFLLPLLLLGGIREKPKKYSSGSAVAAGPMVEDVAAVAEVGLRSVSAKLGCPSEGVTTGGLGVAVLKPNKAAVGEGSGGRIGDESDDEPELVALVSAPGDKSPGRNVDEPGRERPPRAM